MRLRFLGTDYFEEASKAAGQCYQQNQLPVPVPSCCLFPVAGCAALVSSWMLPKLLSEITLVVVGNSLEMQQLCISMVQVHFLSAVLPHKLVQEWTFSHSVTLEYLSKAGLPPQEIVTGELNSKWSPHFESMVLDLPQQNDLATVVVSEVSSIIGGYASTWESQLHKQPGDKCIFYQDTGKGIPPCQIQNALTKYLTGYSANLQAELKLVSDGCTHSSSIFLDKSKLRLPVLEVPKLEEAFTCSEMPPLSNKLYMKTIEMGVHLAHIQLADVVNLLETEITQSATRIFSVKFYEQLPWQNFGHSCRSSDMQLLNLLSHGKTFPNVLSSQALGLPMLELPVPSWEVNKNGTSCSCKCFVKLFDMPHQFLWVQTPTILDSIHSATFETLIVEPELVYKDYVFSSLPVPALKEKESCIAMDAMQEALSVYKHAVPLALDFLYLDWHFSHKKDCGKQPCFVLESRLSEIARYKPLTYAFSQEMNIDAHVASNETIMGGETKRPLEKESPVCSPKQSCSLESRESACPLLPPCQAKSLERAFEGGVGVLVRSPNKHTGSPKMEASVAKKSSQGMFASDELNFFLNARHGTVNANTAFESSEWKKIPEAKCFASCNSKGDYQVHHIILSKPILKLRACLELDYLRILQNDASLAHELEKHEVLNSLKTEADAKAALVFLIKEGTKNQNTPHEQQLLRGLIALYVLQQTAENLSMYGIQVGHLYMESWYLNLRFLQDLVCCSYAECEEAYRQVEKGSLLDHPKLTCLGDILSKHRCKVWNPKILLIAERRALFTLYKKIISCNLRPYQFDREENLSQNFTASTDLLNQAVTEASLKCDCLMVPPEYITKSFPIKVFSCIVQYGHFSSNTEDIEFSIQNSGSEVHILQTMAKDHGCISNEKDQNCEEVLQKAFSNDQGSTPALHNVEKLSGKVQQAPTMEGSTSSHNKPDLEMGVFVKSTDTLEIDSTSASILPATDIFSSVPLTYRQCETNIVVNINQSYNYLLSGRHSSYQKILAFEKEGMNVVERDLCLPIDMILSPAVCLIWYTKEKLPNSDPGSDQMLPLACIEGITNDIMKALSFSFRTCIMIFEGQSEFVAEAMQIFGYLQAAAIGLDIQLQCFISGSSTTTDVIIANCILEMKKLRKTSSVPAMLEAEPLAESFLTAFASINALAAHAILSCGIELGQFMSLKVEEQLKLTEIFDLSERSLLLFKQQAQNGSSKCLYKKAKHTCPGDHFNTTHSKKGKTLPASNKGSSPKERFIQCQQVHFTDTEDEWHPFAGLRKATVDDDLLPENEAETENDGKDCQKSTCITKQRVHSIQSPLQLNTSPAREHEKRMKRTIDLILQRNSSQKGKGVPPLSEARSCMKSPAAKIAKDPWLEPEERNSPDVWLYSPVGAVLSPELDPEITLKTETGHTNNAWSCRVINNKNFQRTPNFCHVASKFSRNLDHPQKPHSSVYEEQVYKKAMDVDLENLFDYDLQYDISRHSKRECPMEFANETREHLKRKLDFESPANAKHFNRCQWERQESSKSNIFDKYRYEGREQSEVQESISGRHSGVDLFDIPRKHPQQDTCTQKRVSCKNPKIQRKTYRNWKRGLPSTNQYKGPAGSTELNPSWTPYDKRSKKVLSFVKKGNDCQSRLVWERSQDLDRQRNPLLPT